MIPAASNPAGAAASLLPGASTTEAVSALRRAVTREELWNGNRERLRDHLSFDPMRSMPAYVWTFYDRKKAQLEAAEVDPTLAHLEFVRLRSHAEAAAWLASLG